MHAKRQLLFVQGGGAGVHDEWDDKLVASRCLDGPPPSARRMERPRTRSFPWMTPSFGST